MNKLMLGVNIDHIATLRQVRGTRYPDPIFAAQIAESAGADGITVHLREDRRHIQDHDVSRLAKSIKTRMNLEMAVTDEMLSIAERIQPAHCCLVPEKREELTTEGGLAVAENRSHVEAAVARLKAANIRVSLFIEPSLKQVEAAYAVGADDVELHTGHYALASKDQQIHLVQMITTVAQHAASLGLRVNAGHGLNYDNVQTIASVPIFYELNIGHAIIAESMFIGLKQAVEKMSRLIAQARGT